MVLICAKRTGNMEKVGYILSVLGDIQAMVGEFEKAIEMYKKSLKIKDSFDTHIKLGNIYLKRGEYENAEGEFNKASSLLKDDKSILIVLNPGREAIALYSVNSDLIKAHIEFFERLWLEGKNKCIKS